MSFNVIRSVVIALFVVFCPKVQAGSPDGGRIVVPMSVQKNGPKMQALMDKALKGSASAQFQLAQIYEKGNQWVKRDPAAAIAWYEEAASQGHVGAAKALKVRN